jgi:outer membrane receptor protein involved in Fe transport
MHTDPATGGVCTNPFNDFGETEANSYVDAKMSYKFTQQMRADLAVQNLLNEPESQWDHESGVTRKYSAGAGRVITAGLRYTF